MTLDNVKLQQRRKDGEFEDGELLAGQWGLDTSVGGSWWFSRDGTTVEEMLDGPGGGSSNWGDIGGTLSDQTDLQSALDGKEASIGAKGTAFNKNFGTGSGDVAQGNDSRIVAGGTAVQPGDNISTLTNNLNFADDQTGPEIKALYEGEANTNAYTDSEKSKLAGLESSHYKGLYASEGALTTAHPTADPGDYARVDLGVGEDVVSYIWDDDDDAWVQEQGTATAETEASIKTKYEANADTNAFTDAEKSNLANQSGTNTGDQDLSGLQPKPAEGQFADGDKTKLDAITGTNTGDQDISGIATNAAAISALQTAPFWVEVVLTGSGEDIAAGTAVAYLTHTIAGTITGFKLVCDPGNEPSAAAVQVDLNSVNLSTGAATSRLSAVASIATGANVSTGGTIDGTQTVAFGDQSSFDIDQGSDGKELRALVQITPSAS